MRPSYISKNKIANVWGELDKTMSYNKLASKFNFTNIYSRWIFSLFLKRAEVHKC